MIISYQWLMDYLPAPLPVDELSQMLTSIGLEVEAVEKKEGIKGGMEGFVVGEVLTCAPHPDADKLKITTVSIGHGEPLPIVCGAPNVASGQKVVVATVGATIYPLTGEPFKIKKAKIRGAVSEGMICAADEIGVGTDHAGIIILPENVQPGTPAIKCFDLPETDYAIHIGLTPNRSDANSHIGVARDICSYLTYHTGREHQVKFPETHLPESEKAEKSINVTIEAPEACPRYMGLTIRNLQIGPSPEWMQQRLATIGVRSINNVVDVTNYILHEYGQPLHAFDEAKINGGEIKVRFEPAGTPFMTLDGKERKLQGTDLMICDATQGMCIAGVSGGANSGITDGTTSLFLESAYFEPKHIRRSSLHHGLRTDAATHFEKGVDINNLEPAILRAAQLICDLTGGTISSGITDIYPTAFEPDTIQISYDYIHKLTGKEYAPAKVNELLKSLGFSISHHDEYAITVAVPSNKPDVLQPADIVEEILRMDGLDNVAIPQRLNIALTKAMPNDRTEREKVAQELCGIGFQEIITNSIVNSKYYPGREDLVTMINSLSSELDVMRPSLLESGLEVIAYNTARKENDLLLFEAGNIYNKQQDKYHQESKLALFSTGKAVDNSWNGKEVKADIYFLKGTIQLLLKKEGIQNLVLVTEEASISWKWKNQALCILQVVPEERLGLFGIKQPVCYAVIDWALWLKATAAAAIRFSEVPKYPAVKRDLALVLDKSVAYQKVQQITDKLKLGALQSYALFDIFESEKLGVDKKSLALTYTFQLTDRTLTDEETEALMAKLATAYQQELGAQIRG